MMKVGWHEGRVVPHVAMPSSTATLRRQCEDRPSRAAVQTFRKTFAEIMRAVASVVQGMASYRTPKVIEGARA